MSNDFILYSLGVIIFLIVTWKLFFVDMKTNELLQDISHQLEELKQLLKKERHSS